MRGRGSHIGERLPAVTGNVYPVSSCTTDVAIRLYIRLPRYVIVTSSWRRKQKVPSGVFFVPEAVVGCAVVVR